MSLIVGVMEISKLFGKDNYQVSILTFINFLPKMIAQFVMFLGWVYYILMQTVKCRGKRLSVIVNWKRTT